MRVINIESLTNDLVQKSIDKTLILNKAIKLITDEFGKHDELTIEQSEDGFLLVKGRTYGQAKVNLDEEFRSIKTTNAPEDIARKMLEIIMIDFHGDSDHVL